MAKTETVFVDPCATCDDTKDIIRSYADATEWAWAAVGDILDKDDPSHFWSERCGALFRKLIAERANAVPFAAVLPLLRAVERCQWPEAMRQLTALELTYEQRAAVECEQLDWSNPPRDGARTLEHVIADLEVKPGQHACDDCGAVVEFHGGDRAPTITHKPGCDSRETDPY